MIELIFSTVVLIGIFGGINLYLAYGLGGDYYVIGNYARRKNWIEKILDGLEVLRKM